MNILDKVGLEKVLSKLKDTYAPKSHISDTYNPHKVTKSQVGLGNVENKSSSTIREEIDISNVTNALGYTPAKSDPAGTNLGLVKSGGDVTISNGLITVDDDSHNHTIENVKGLQGVLDSKATSSHNHDDRYFTESKGDNRYSPKIGSTSLNKLASSVTLGDGNGASILQNGATYQQKIEIVDDSEADTDVFVFSQSTNNGESFTQLMSIKDDGNVEANRFTGDLSGNASSASSVPWGGVSGKPGTFPPSSHTHDDRYYTESEVDSKLSGKSNSDHNHDSRYYTETETNNLLNGKSNSNHTHPIDSSLSSTSVNPVQNKIINSALADKVPIGRTVNGKPLSSNISLSYSDVGADKSGTASTKATEALNSAKSYTDLKVDAIVGDGASEALDTIGEISKAIEDNQDMIETLNSAIGSKANKTDLTSHTGNTGIHVTSTEKNNWNSAKTHASSAHAPSNAEPNQNAFSNVVVGATTISADNKTDSLTLAGSNITITPDATNDKLTFGLTKANVTNALGYTPPTQDTKYTHPTSSGNKHIPSGGSSGQILRWSADGTAVWGADNNTTYGVGSSTNLGLTKLYTGTGSAADGTMTQNAITSALNGKANSSHNHSYLPLTGGNLSGDLSVKNRNILSEIDSLKSKLSHVGMIIYSSTLDTMEKVIAIYGGSEWVKIEGRFLFGVSESKKVGVMGGEEYHTLIDQEVPNHRHTVGNHSHSIPPLSGTAASNGNHQHNADGNLTATSAGNHAHTADGNLTAAGNGNHTHNVNMKYKSDVSLNGKYSRAASDGTSTSGTVGTALTAGWHTHDITGNTNTTGAHTHDITGVTNWSGAHTHSVSTNANTTGLGSTFQTTDYGGSKGHNNMPPYKVVYIWERTK